MELIFFSDNTLLRRIRALLDLFPQDRLHMHLHYTDFRYCIYGVFLLEFALPISLVNEKAVSPYTVL